YITSSRSIVSFSLHDALPISSVSSFGGASVKRIHRPVDSEGKTISVGSYMIPRLQAKCEELGVEFIMNTTANEILTDANGAAVRSEEHTPELQSRFDLVCRLL